MVISLASYSKECKFKSYFQFLYKKREYISKVEFLFCIRKVVSSNLTTSKKKLNMKSLIIKDKNNRIYIKHEALLLKDKKNLFKIKRYKKKIQITIIKNRCVFSGKGKSVFSKYKISRIFFKELSATLQINNVYKQ